MGRKDRRAFSEEYKLDAVRRVEIGGRSVADVAKELGLSASLLQNWRRKYRDAEKLDASRPAVSLEEENRRLRRENASLREDREILKKASTFFAKELR